MTEQQIANSVDELIAIVADGKPMEAFDKFYHDNLEKIDLNGVLVKGKQKNAEIGLTLLSKVSNIRDFTAVGKIVKGNRSFLVWSLDFDHADNGQVKVLQVAIQDWEDGKIVLERFIA